MSLFWHGEQAQHRATQAYYPPQARSGFAKQYLPKHGYQDPCVAKCAATVEPPSIQWESERDFWTS